MKNIIEININEKVYSKKKEESLSILNKFNLEVKEGEKLSIVGESGVGKTSLLNILGLIDSDFDGTYRLFGEDTLKLNEKEKSKLRNKKIGFALQESALIDSLSIEENIKLPLMYIDSKDQSFDQKEYNEMIHTIGIESILKKKPNQCSGGQRSRAVFARSIIMKPNIILSDEPTSSLDVENKEKIMNLLFKMNEKYNTTIITVTHDLEVANQHDRVIRLERSK